MRFRATRTMIPATLLVCAAIIQTPLQASEPEKDVVEKHKLQEVVEQSQEQQDKARKITQQQAEKKEVGEASYNVQDCEALMEEAGKDNSAGKAVSKSELDKCEQIIK